MAKQKTTKKALLSSVLSLVLCLTMLIGTTFAWFTDSVTSANNKIVAGNLDVDVYYGDPAAKKSITGVDTLFDDVTLWEPGAVAWENLTVINLGTLALKYQMAINFSDENTVNGYGLSQVLKVGFVKGGIQNGDAGRDAVISEVSEWTPMTSFNVAGEMETQNETDTYGMVIYWEPTSEDNNWNVNNGKTTSDGEKALHIDLGINLVATQYTYENDSFGNDYDEDAPWIEVKVTPANIQEYLDGKHGSLENKKLILEAGDYEKLVIGTPTKYAGSDTVMFCETHNATFTDAEEFKDHLSDGQYHTTPRYTRTIKNLVLAGGDGVTVDGVEVTSGHIYGDVDDNVLDKNYDAGSAYYLTHDISNVTFEGISFVNKVDINTSQADTSINGITFKDCNFTTVGATTFALRSSTATFPAIRYYNEANNGRLQNLTVDNCSFNDCFQGVYTHHVKGITVTNSKFTNTAHNAIALQSHDGAVNFGNVVITNNTFDGIGDRIIRFNEIGNGSNISIKYNAATNSGDEDGEVIKATSIAQNVTFDVTLNAWGEGKKVANKQLQNKEDAVAAMNSVELTEAIKAGETTILVGDGNYVAPDDAKGKTLTIIGNGNTVIATQDDGSYEGCDYSLEGATVTFENVTITTDSRTYTGYARLNATFNNCTINGTYTLYDNTEFNNCTFNVSGDVYNIWTWGAPNATFNNCTFNSDGKAILLYGGVSTKLTVNNCEFNDNGGLTDLKAAIEIGNDYNQSYTLIVNNTVVNGYEINDKGISTGTTLWSNKNSMSTDKLNVIVDGVDVY